MQHPDHGEMPSIFCEKLLLLINCYAQSVLPLVPRDEENIPGSPTVESLVEPFGALALVLFDILVKDRAFTANVRMFGG